MSGDRPASPWLPSSQARPLVCWRDGQVRALAQALDQALAGWAVDWGLQPLQPVDCAAAEGLDARLPWRSVQVAGTCMGWLQVDVNAAARLAALLFPGSRAPGPIAAGAGQACERDAAARALAILDLPAAATGDGSPAATDAHPWSGALQVQLPAPLGRQLLLTAAAMEAWCKARGLWAAVPPAPASAPLACAVDAAGLLPVSLRVLLRGCEIDIGTLQGLRAGDVLRMQHRIDAPAIVTDAAGTALFRAYLGRRAGSRAVELAPVDPHRTEPLATEEQA